MIGYVSPIKNVGLGLATIYGGTLDYSSMVAVVIYSSNSILSPYQIVTIKLGHNDSSVYGYDLRDRSSNNLGNCWLETYHTLQVSSNGRYLELGFYYFER